MQEGVEEQSAGLDLSLDGLETFATEGGIRACDL